MQKNSLVRINVVFACSLSVLAVVAWTRREDHLDVFATALAGLSMTVGCALMNVGFRRARKFSTETKHLISLVEHSDDVVVIGSVDRKLRYMNRAGRETLGFAAEFPIQGTPSSTLYADGFDQVIEGQVIPAIRRGEVWRGEVLLRHRGTDEVIPVQSNTFSLYDSESGATIGFAMVGKDLREQKALRRDLDRFFTASIDMLAIANLQGYFLRLNPAFFDVLGWTEAEMLAQPAAHFIHPDDLEATRQQTANQAKGAVVHSFENRYRTKSGEYRWLSWKSYPDGNVTYGAARDVTEEKKRAAEMAHLGKAAVAASLAKSEFLANMSHEIRTPINGVIGSVALLLDTPLNEEQKDYADDVSSSANSLLGLINDILDFSKIEAGKLDVEVVDFSLETLVAETVQHVSWSLRNKSLPLSVAGVKDAAPFYRGDPARIRQVLSNLLSNAVKFTATGSIHLDVRAVPVEAGRTKLRISVTDTGIGIPVEAQARLFQPFTQADESTTRRFGGTGLGLSISHRLVQLMGGEMGMNSVPGTGSTFWFTLPVDASVKTAADQTSVPALTASRFEGASILVAEDNVINQKILLSMLRKMGFKAQAVANGLEVLAILRDVPFDLILMDCQMPDMDGYEATRRVRAHQNPAVAALPIIAMTANAIKGDRERCLDAGMNDYASKPIGVGDLVAVIERWLKPADEQRRTS